MDGLCVGAPMLNVGQEFGSEENRGVWFIFPHPGRCCCTSMDELINGLKRRRYLYRLIQNAWSGQYIRDIRAGRVPGTLGEGHARSM